MSRFETPRGASLPGMNFSLVRSQLSLPLSLALLCGALLAPLAAPASAQNARQGLRAAKAPKLTYERGDRSVPRALRTQVRRRRTLLVALRLRPVGPERLARRGRELRRLSRRVERARGVRVVRRFKRLPLVSVRVRSVRALRGLARSRRVASVSVNKRVRKLDSAALGRIGQPALIARGASGAGAEVAVLDNGLDLGDYFGSCPGAGAPGCSVAQIVDVAGGGKTPADDHGTAVASIVHAVAPGARIFAYDVFSGETASYENIARALDLVVARRRSAKGPTIANMSLGLPDLASCADGGALAPSVRQAAAAGVITVAASGNDGAIDQVAYPSCLEGVQSVGATADSAFSETIDGRRFDYGPDDVLAYSNSSEQLDVWGTVNWTLNGEVDFNGTSAASPSVAGIGALLASARPSAGTEAVSAALVNNGPLVTDRRNAVARRRVDGPAALNALGGRVTPPVLPDSGLGRLLARYYGEILGRGADEYGLRYWYDRVSNGACASEVRYMFASFFLLEEYRARNARVEDTVDRMYRGGLGRAPDAENVRFWAGRIGERGLAHTLASFSALPEFESNSIAPACG